VDAMDHEETSRSRPQSPKAEPIAAPNEAELSRIAREAVHQPADPRLDRQLARMGVMEAADAAVDTPGQAAGRSAESSAEVERLGARLRRVEIIVGLLAAAVAILALVALVLLVR
jgi:hypothetical protein